MRTFIIIITYLFSLSNTLTTPFWCKFYTLNDSDIQYYSKLNEKQELNCFRHQFFSYTFSFSKLGGKKKRNEIINWMQRYMSMYIEHRYMYHSTRFNKQLSKFNTDVGIIIYKSKDKMYIYTSVYKKANVPTFSSEYETSSIRTL